MTRSRKRKLMRGRAKLAVVPLASTLVAGARIGHATDDANTALLAEMEQASGAADSRSRGCDT